jgi:digeranylgeranylglycerophospholipid reductase
MREDYDVIVVGAGPAGSMAAKTAAQSGLSTLLIEKRQEIGEPVRCAEGIAADSLGDLVEVKPGWICARVRRARIHAPSGAFLDIADDRDAAYILERKVFDRDLAKAAASAGAEVYTKTQATGLVIEEGRVCGVRGKSLGEDFYAGARVVVAADGIESRVARWAGMDTALRLKDVGSCVQFRLANVDVDPGCCEFYFGSSYAPRGYAWVFPKGSDEANVGLGLIHHRNSSGAPIQYLERFVGRKFPGASVLGSVAGAVPISGRMPRLSTGGLVLAGDAGRLTDPVTGEGIANGMISGQIAGRIVAGCVRKGDVSARSLSEYDREIAKALGPALDRNYLLKEQLRRSGDTRLNLIFGAVKAMGVESYPASRVLREVYSPRSNAVARVLMRILGS